MIQRKGIKFFGFPFLVHWGYLATLFVGPFNREFRLFPVAQYRGARRRSGGGPVVPETTRGESINFDGIREALHSLDIQSPSPDIRIAQKQALITCHAIIKAAGIK